ncbi:MAG: class I SAM-dependent rRNA methyltransferase [Verrucomicrobiota bacterium]
MNPYRQPMRRQAPPAPEYVPPAGSENWDTPWVQLKYFTYQPAVYPRMLAGSSPKITPGDIVTVYDKNGDRFGAGFYNARARVPLRMIHHSANEPADDSFFLKALERAVELRRDILKLDAVTEAYRVVNSDGDGLSGLIIDRYADVLLADVHSLGVWQRLPNWMPRLHELLGTKRHLIRVDEEIARIEGIRPDPVAMGAPRLVKFREHGVRYEVNFEEGHKTGFFCDQRENRLKLSQLVSGKTVLDLCCYTGGFSLGAKVLGGAAEVTAVDLDEKAIAQAQRNANLNQVKGIDWVHTDAFSYVRTKIRSEAPKWDIVVLDPPKLVHSRDEIEENGRQKYEDLNRLAIELTASGGLFLTCSCSGLVTAAEFEQIVTKAAHRAKRRLQFLDATGPGADHPVMSNCPEGRYLKTLWARVW